jgi:uncharacterized membrane protein
VSLEAIFLSTFVMISQNRADEKRQVLADHQWQTVQEEDQQNQQLLELSNQILELTRAIHQMAAAQAASGTHPAAANGTQPRSPDGAGGERVDSPTKEPSGGLVSGTGRS